MQILLKQSTAAIETIAQVFYLSDGEKHLLLSADVGQGLFFAGPAHAAMRVIASPEEHAVATTRPQDTHKEEQGQPNQQTSTPEDQARPPVPTPELPRSNRPIFTVETVGPKS